MRLKVKSVQRTKVKASVSLSILDRGILVHRGKSFSGKYGKMSKIQVHHTHQSPLAVPCTETMGCARRTKKITVVFQPCEHICEVDNRWSLKNMGSHGNGSALKVPSVAG